ncbi:MAG TPA: uroporphyrinogen-III synthase [Solimonas sp.]|nr:uroporphyrinogen-III synthase [Solimonas sp.]
MTAVHESQIPNPESRPLAGLRILVTRPAQQTEALSRLLAARGAEVVRLPMQAIEPARQAQQAAERMAQARDFDGWIFTSANAVKFAAALDAGVWPRLLAVGGATAAALTALGREAQVPADEFSSEGLLALPELQASPGRRWLVVTGADGPGQLAEALRARGATVEIAEVYRRVALPHTEDAVLGALRGTQAIVATSAEGLEHLVHLTPEARRPGLLRKQLAVPSRRVVEKALELGFHYPPLVPEQVSDPAFVRCLEQWHAGRT